MVAGHGNNAPTAATEIFGVLPHSTPSYSGRMRRQRESKRVTGRDQETGVESITPGGSRNDKGNLQQKRKPSRALGFKTTPEANVPKKKDLAELKSQISNAVGDAPILWQLDVGRGLSGLFVGANDYGCH